MSSSNPKFLAGERLYLRPVEKGDLSLLQIWANDPELRGLTGQTMPTSQAGMDEFLERLRTDCNRVWFVVVVKADCRYHRPARYDDLLRIHTKVSRISAAKIEHEYRVFRGEELLAVGHVLLAIVDRQGNVQPVPESMRQDSLRPT